MLLSHHHESEGESGKLASGKLRQLTRPPRCGARCSACAARSRHSLYSVPVLRFKRKDANLVCTHCPALFVCSERWPFLCPRAAALHLKLPCLYSMKPCGLPVCPLPILSNSSNQSAPSRFMFTDGTTLEQLKNRWLCRGEVVTLLWRFLGSRGGDSWP